jgi:hypothetical protein
MSRDAAAEAELAAGLEAGWGGPGPEDCRNGAAALAAALVREARALAQTAAALRSAVAVLPGDPSGGPMADIRRQRAALLAVGEAALRAALLLEAGGILGGADGGPGEQAERIAAAARRAGLSPAGLAAPLRAAALALATDDGAARIAATILAQQLADALRG